MIELTDEMRRAIDHSLEEGHPVVSASVGADGQPSLAFYGSAQAYSHDQLAVWVRNPEAGFLRRIAANPSVALLYRNPSERVMWQFHGQARVVADEDVRNVVFDNSPKAERDRDPERAGMAVLIDLDRVIERGQVIMSRDGVDEGSSTD